MKLLKETKLIDDITVKSKSVTKIISTQKEIFKINLIRELCKTDRQLAKQVLKNGEKITAKNIIKIEKINGKIIWIERGTTKAESGRPAGLAHILEEHEKEFLGKGISEKELPDYIMFAIKNGETVERQGKTRKIYLFKYKGKERAIAIDIGSNGFIVGANDKSVKKLIGSRK